MDSVKRLNLLSYNHVEIMRKYLLWLVFIIVGTNHCQSQIQYGNELKAKIRSKLDSLYPHASGNVVFNDKYVSDTTQEIEINCHCDEANGMIVLVFDINGNLLNKDIHYIPMNKLPDTIANYIKKSASPAIKFVNDYIKCINNKGELSYGIIEDYTPQPWYFKEYMLKFKPTGELISKEELPLAQQ